MKLLKGSAVGLLLLMWSCNYTPRSLKFDDYQQWILSPDNGLNKSKRINDVEVNARFIPAEYLAYREFQSADSGISYDSILKSYQCGLTFQITLGADKQHASYGNLLQFDVMDQGELAERTRYLNFQIADFIKLTQASQVYEPVLSNFEGYNSLNNQLSFQVVFSTPDYSCEGDFANDADNIRITFADPFWNLGTNHFEFENKIIENVPKMDL